MLEFELIRIGDVLILTTAAIAEIPALRSDAIGRWLDDPNEPGARKAFFCFGNFSFDKFADQNKRNEDDKIFDSRDTFTTECDVGNGEGQVFANGGTHSGHGREVQTLAKAKFNKTPAV